VEVENLLSTKLNLGPQRNQSIKKVGLRLKLVGKKPLNFLLNFQKSFLAPKKIFSRSC